MARGKGLKTLVDEIRKHRRDAAFHCLNFFNNSEDESPVLWLVRDQRLAVETYIRKAFEHWWDSWVEPLLAEIEAKGIKRYRRFRITPR